MLEAGEDQIALAACRLQPDALLIEGSRLQQPRGLGSLIHLSRSRGRSNLDTTGRRTSIMLPQPDVLRPQLVDPARDESRSGPDRPGLQEGAVDQESSPHKVEPEPPALPYWRGRWRWI